MKSKALAAILSLLILIAIALPCFGGSIESSIIEYNGSESLQTFTKRYLPENVGATSEWYVFALAHNKGADLSAYRDALVKYLDGKKVSSATTRLKFALAFIAAGDRDNAYISEALGNSVGAQGIMSLVFGLHVYNNVDAEAGTVNGVVSSILSLEKADGGWAVTGNYADPDVTAMVVQSLAPYYGANSDVGSAVDRAILKLSQMQRANGSFASYGSETSESCSQVIIALRSLGIDPERDSRFIKNGSSVYDALLTYRNTDGGFAHVSGGESNPLATAEAYCALAAMSLNDGRLFLYDKTPETPPSTVGDHGGNTTTSPGEPAVPGTDDPGETDLPGTDEPIVTDKPVTDKPVTDKPEDPAITTTGGDKTGDPAVDDNNNDNNRDRNKPSYKIYVSIAIIASGIIVSVILIALKKRNKLNFLFIAIVVTVLISIVLITDISSKEDYYKAPDTSEEYAGRVTISIDCNNIEDGRVILEPTEYGINEGDTVYDVLIRAAKEHSILIDSSGGGSVVYIAGIDNVYEYDHGELSGWMYLVNGETPSVGCAGYTLSDGDVIAWRYSLDIGNDLKEDG